MADLVEKVTCRTATEFLDSISPRGEYFRETNPQDWIFRGLSDDKYQLVPSALREDDKLWEIAERELTTVRHQIRAERTIIV